MNMLHAPECRAGGRPTCACGGRLSDEGRELAGLRNGALFETLS